MRMGRVASATEPPNCGQVILLSHDLEKPMAYLEVIGNVVVLASWCTEQRVIWGRLGLVGGWRLGVG